MMEFYAALFARAVIFVSAMESGWMKVCRRWLTIAVAGLWVVLSMASAMAGESDLSRKIPLRPSVLNAEDVAVVYNVNDAQSEEVARYYMQARQVPQENLIAVELPRSAKDVLTVPEFETLKAQLLSLIHI